jgi:TfoX/Sxy family transcriptional regulator of competence genes
MAKPKRTKTKTPAKDAEVDPRFQAVAAAFAGDPHVTSGKMMASIGLKVNGKIFAMMSRGKLVAKLPKDRVDELVRSGAGAYFDPRRDGRLMKEWIELHGTKPSWIELAKEAYRFVTSRA